MYLKKKLCLAAVTVGLWWYLRLVKRRKSRRWWVRPINANRKNQGDYHNLIQEMRLQDPDMFFNYTRLNIEQFDLLLSWVGPVITKKSLREAISPGARLAVTLRHLAAGDSIPTLAFSYRIGKSTACQIINETCDALWTVCQPRVLQEPSREDWKTISDGFQKKWNLPNCVGAIDGKHVRMRAPYMSGSAYFNYKKTFSIVLFAMCDYNCCFTYGGILKSSEFGYKLNNDQLDLPENAPFPGMLEKKPYYFVGDEAFPLQMTLLRPFEGKNLSDTERIYNYRLSRARRCIENAFGIIVARLRIFHVSIFKLPENVDRVVKATVCLHNFIRVVKATVCLHNFIKKQEDLLAPEKRRYCPKTFVDNEVNGQLTLGEWRNEVPDETSLRPVSELRRRIGTRNARESAITYRNYLKEYVNSEVGSVPWQHYAVNR